jgi:hypothetical protein
MVGDDSPFLYELTQSGSLLNQYQLFQPDKIKAGRIPKKRKPDFEGMTLLKINQKTCILLIGSGSRENRQTAYLFDLHTKQADDYDFSPLYTLFQAKLIENEELNIEALAQNGESIFFFQRGNISNQNTVFAYSLPDFIAFLQTQKATEPKAVYSFTLPLLDGVQAGVSGACWVAELSGFLFSASVERTSNAIDDGEVLGSYVGIWNPLTQQVQAELVYENGQIYQGKIESIAHKSTFADSWQAYAATDADGGMSELLLLEGS